MYDPDIEERLNTGSQLTTAGIVVLVLAFLGTCGAVVSSAGEPNSAAQGVEIGQSPWLLISLAVGITLIVLGQVRKSNARREAEERYLEANTRVDVVLDDASPEGPFRGDMKEVEVLDPIVAAAAEAERERDHKRGTGYLTAGGVVLVVTIAGMLMVSMGDSGGSPHRKVENVLVAFGLAMFPFGLGLYLGIKGLLLRSK